MSGGSPEGGCCSSLTCCRLGVCEVQVDDGAATAWPALTPSARYDARQAQQRHDEVLACEHDHSTQHSTA
jgi:hypothetical protein